MLQAHRREPSPLSVLLSSPLTCGLLEVVPFVFGDRPAPEPGLVWRRRAHAMRPAGLVGLAHGRLDVVARPLPRMPVQRRLPGGFGCSKAAVSKGLIQEVGRADSPGRPILYSVTSEFLQFFGLSSLSDLPPLSASVVEEEPKTP